MARRTKDEPKKPVHVERVTGPGSVLEVSCWKNTVEVESGREIEVDAITISRSYKDGSEWKKTQNLRKADLLTVSHMLERAFDYLIEE